MARRNRQNRRATPVGDVAASMRRTHWQTKARLMGEGRRERASTYADRRHVANKRACRDTRYW
jgi:hypothetical protein